MKKALAAAAIIVFTISAQAQQRIKMEKPTPAQIEQRQAEKLKMMQTDLNLSDAQVNKIKSVQDRHRSENNQLMAERKTQMKAQREMVAARRQQHQAEMKEILTPEQFEKWQSKKQDRMQRMSQARKMQHRKHR